MKLLQRNFFSEASSAKLLQQNLFRKTSSVKLLQRNFFSKTSLAKLLQRNFFSEASSVKLLQQNFFSKSSSAKLFQQDFFSEHLQWNFFCETSSAKLLQQNFLSETTDVVGVLSRGSCVRTPVSEDPPRRTRYFLFFYRFKMIFRVWNTFCMKWDFIFGIYEDYMYIPKIPVNIGRNFEQSK